MSETNPTTDDEDEQTRLADELGRIYDVLEVGFDAPLTHDPID